MTLRLHHEQNTQLRAGRAASAKDRPRQGANRSGAGSPITQERVREVYSMTDASESGTEWVPRFGMLEVPAERAVLIRGLFELAAFVADHPELPVPGVQASFYTGGGGWQAKQAVVDQVAVALGEQPAERSDVGFYEVAASFGSVRVKCTAITAESMARWNAATSYENNVQPDVAAGESR